MADALNAPKKDHDYIRHLYNAALAVPIRLRVDPPIQAVQLDSLGYSEMLRQSGTASIDSFWEFVAKVDSIEPMHDILLDKKKTIKEVEAAAERFKIRFKGKALSKAMPQCLRALQMFVDDRGCKDAYMLLETVSTCMNDLTKLWKLAHVTSNQFTNLGTREATGAFALQFLHADAEISAGKS